MNVSNSSFQLQGIKIWTMGLVLSCLSLDVFSATVSDYQAVPPLLSESATPLVMLALSNDHQLFYKAFTDYDDLDGNGVIEITYDHSFEYVGYFDSFKCYEYDTVSSRFNPVASTATKYCNAASSVQWSGNFLNWATMTRIDEVRKVLYGGKRSTDTLSETILERAFLTTDAHSFAKYYNGADLARLTPFSGLPTGLVSTKDTGITLCNTTKNGTAALSQNETAPPLVRVVSGNYSLWAANERWQCLYSEEKSASNGNDSGVTKIYAYGSNPSKAKQAVQADTKVIGDYVVRVKVCDAALGVSGEGCKQYPSGNYKPIGVLQKFGDSESVLWGLVTGSYGKNKSGGVLRKNISPFTDEVNTETDGTFKSVPAGGGIVHTINQLRMVNYNYADGTYNSSDSCSWGINTFSNGKCSNWGNPFSEILLECYRYFAGASATTGYASNDSSFLAGLTASPPWKNPQDNNSACARLNVIAFNASTVSYDGDELSGISDLGTTKTAEALTKTVGDGESITGKYFFVGENGGASAAEKNQLCTAKLVSDLGKVEGTCPDSPRLDGSFKAAGISYYANTNDLRSDLDDRQNVSTYGVTLTPALPKVTITSPGGKKVTILPACRNDSVGGNCGLVDFKIVEEVVTATKVSGAFYVNWEDSEQGGDYDQDMNGILRYELTATKLKITTDVFADSTPYKMGFGFVVSGTTEDGFHALSGINSFSGYGCSGCTTADGGKEKEFTLGDSVISGSTVGLLKQPLYYAAKWGGFIDKDGDGKPNLQEEWDNKNNVTGDLVSDGTPDNYFLAINPKQLQDQLTNILVSILERTASGTSAAVVTNTGSGEGALYQALYNPRLTGFNKTDSVDWVGTLNALYIDSYGHIREDNALPKGSLTDADHIVKVFYNPLNRKTQVQRYLLGVDGATGAAVGSPTDVSDIDPVWSAREELAKVTSYTVQRTPYSNKANLGRYILTSIDRDGDGQIGMTSAVQETLPFVPLLFNPLNGQQYFRLLGLNSTNGAEATNIVNYVRGEAVTGYRNRRIDLDGDGTADPVLLGDIVHSSPIAVGRPAAGYDLAFGDDTYRNFRQAYQRRRQVVYVGANDGMLHAFNAGFYNSLTSAYELKATTETEHPLGSELWAYVPYNVLPHLQWLTKADYPHVYYVDGTVKNYDVNIFADDATHPGGWGTILVVGMRFGGGEYTLDPNDDADGDPSDDITLKSGYVILDITDPESPPVVLAEITHPDMGYSLAEPTVVKMRAADPLTGSYQTPAVNKWYVVMASGPAGTTAAGRESALHNATSEKSAKLFAYDLNAKSLTVIDTGESASFIGGVHASDWTNDYIDDAVYFGVVSGTIDNPTGKLKRAILDASGGSVTAAFSDVLDVTNKPFSATPLTVRDRLGEYWVYSGTGRFYVVGDNFSNKQQSYFGVKERKDVDGLTGTAVAVADLINTTDIKIYQDGSIDSKSNPGSAINLNGLTSPAKNFQDVYQAVQASKGWYFDFARYRSRNITQAVISDQSLVFTEYQPSGLKCQPEGYGFLNAPHMQAGIPGAFAPLGTNPGSTNADGEEEVNLSESLGLGSPSAPSLYQRGDGKKMAIVQNSTGELTSNIIETGKTAGARESWRELDINWE